MFHVYICQSLRFPRRHYIGHTDDTARRLREHNSGKTLSLVKYIPVKMIYTETFRTKTETYQRELQIKSYKSGAAFKKLLNSIRI